MNNRIVLLTILTIATVGNVWSQTALSEEARKTQWGIKGGMNIATVNLSGEGKSASMEYVVGAVAGVTVEYTFMYNMLELFFHSGLELSMKGFGYGSGSSSSLEATAVYMQLPLTVGFRFDIGKGWRLAPRIGPYFAYGIAGNTSATVSGKSASVSTFGEKILKPFDAGILYGFYLDRGKLIIGIHGESGLTETNGDSFKITGAKAHMNNTSLTVGYLF